MIGSRLVSTEWPEPAADDHRRRRGDRRVPRPSTATPASRCCRRWPPAARCPGVYPPVTIDGRRYVDGGMRSATNADLAAGYDRVVVLAPDPARRRPDDQRRRARQPAWSRRVAVVSPDAAAGRRSAATCSIRPPARPSARAGRAQAAAGRRAGRRRLDRLTGVRFGAETAHRIALRPGSAAAPEPDADAGEPDAHQVGDDPGHRRQRAGRRRSTALPIVSARDTVRAASATAIRNAAPTQVATGWTTFISSSADSAPTGADPAVEHERADGDGGGRRGEEQGHQQQVTAPSTGISRVAPVSPVAAEPGGQRTGDGEPSSA